MADDSERLALSPEIVVETALHMTQDQGLDSVTMRALAKALDVTPMALYYHVANKDELVVLMVEKVVADRTELVLDERGWQSALRTHMMELWENLRQYPGLALFMFGLPTLGASTSSYESATKFFQDAGFPPRVAHLAWSFAWTYLHGRLSVESHLDRAASRKSGTGAIRARDHVTFGIEAVILALEQILQDPTLVP